RPVRIVAREGRQSALMQKALWKKQPSLPMRSMFGVCRILLPASDDSSARRPSPIKQTMFGRSVPGCWTCWAKDSSGSMPVVHAAAAPAMYFRIVRRFCTLRLSCGSEAAGGRKFGVFRTDVQDVFWLEAQKLERISALRETADVGNNRAFAKC